MTAKFYVWKGGGVITSFILLFYQNAWQIIRSEKENILKLIKTDIDKRKKLKNK